MKSIGIKLADGSFYPLLEEGNPEKKSIDLTTATDGQTKVHVDVYRSDTGTMEGAEYLDTLEMQDLKPHQTGEPTLDLSLDMDETGELQAQITDSETGAKSGIQVTLASRGTALPASKANETPFDFDELEGLTQADEAALTPSTEDAAQPDNEAPSAQEPVADDAAESAPLTQKGKGNADTPSEDPAQQGADGFDMSALDELADEPFDFEPSDNAVSSVGQSATDETPAVPEEAQAAADASATQVPPADEGTGRESEGQADEMPTDVLPPAEDVHDGAPDVDEEEIKSLEELNLDDLDNAEDAKPTGDLAEESLPATDEAAAEDEMPVDEFDLGDLSELNLDGADSTEGETPGASGGDESSTTTIEDTTPTEGLATDEDTSKTEGSPAHELPDEQNDSAQERGRGLLNAAEAKRASLDEADLGDTEGERDEAAEAAENVSSDEFDLGGLEQLGDLGVQDNPDESDEQIMIPDPASLVPEIEDMAESAPTQEAPASEPPADDGVAKEEIPAEDVPPADEIPDAAQTDDGSLEELGAGDTANESPTDEFDLGGLEQLGDLGVQDNPDESDEQIMIPDPASLVPEIEDMAESAPTQETPASEPPADEGMAQEEIPAEDVPPADELTAVEEEEPTAELVHEEVEPAADVSADTAELTAVEELPAIDEASADDVQPVDELSPEEPTVTQEAESKDELAPEETLPPADDTSAEEAEPVEQMPEVATADEGSLDDVNLGSTGEEGSAAAEPTEDVGADDFGLGELDDVTREETAEPVEEVAAQEAEEIPATESDAPQTSEEAQDATLPAQEDDTDLGQLNSEPFDFDAAGDVPAEDMVQEEMPTDETQPATEADEADDFGLGELATMDLGSLADLPDATEDGFSAQEAPDASATESTIPDVTAEAESPDDLQLPSLDDEGETASGEAADFDLPDFDDSLSTQDTAEDFSLPDFDDDMGGDSLDFNGLFDETPSGTDDKPNDDLIFSDEDFSLPDDFLSDTQEDSKTGLGGGAGLFNGLDKEGLYDKATLEGGSPSYSEDDDVKRKTKAPVVICVICAVICVLAAALMLLAELRPDVLRSTFFSKSESSNMISLIESVKSESQAQKATTQDTQGGQDTQAKPTGDTAQKEAGELSSSTPPPKPNGASAANSQNKENSAPSDAKSTQGQAAQPASVEAKEEQIVVASTPERVVPKAPEPNPQKAADVRYKVVWGDTLWDISNAYYRTPWKFRRIASYNGIKDPDKIIAGTWLLLPAE